MVTIYKKIDKNNIDADVIEEASFFLKAGELVAFPTETVYGLGANALDSEASRKIYAAKGRPSDNPLIIHVSNISQVEKIVKRIPDKARKLMEKFWPGPLTIVFEKAAIVPYETTGGLDTVAVRMPKHEIALKLIEYSDVVIAAPSANTSGRPSPTTAKHVKDDLDGRISMIIDGGQVGIGIESTIIDITSDIPVILRPGYITKNMLEEVIGDVDIDRAVLEPQNIEVRPKAPGMKYRHYAPKADFTIYEGDSSKVIRAINEAAKEYEEKGDRVGIIASSETAEKYFYGDVAVIGSRLDELSISKNLYKILREFDDKKMDYILGEAFNSEEFGQAIMNRLLKAAGYQVVRL